ncbi:GNAT family N-acetyltransferase [Paenibacillus sp. BC26]|uniref:GNAT family N-acetyltransferase n=1 Tax=Paenibacillus sp. BC26 TaxID=1881032 RepID=UPI0008E5EB54|nr:GNAT family N-acetyltransferase [Paenibacillus sp. BC26]SFS77342.1 GNAT acetyltransferase [Paenibacillus sp. BC26]
MIELRNDEYYIVLPLMKTVHYKAVYAHSVIENIQPGKIFVNRKIEPTCCLIANRGGRYIVVGDTNDNIFNRDITIFLRDKNNHSIYYDLFTSSDEWIELLEHLLAGQTATLSHSSFIFNETKFKGFNSLAGNFPKEFIVQPLGSSLIEKYQITVSNFGSIEEFLLNGFGYCVLVDNQLVSLCISGSVGNGRAEISIFTNEGYRNIGLAKLTCSAFINHCLEHNLVPNWGCDTGNKASIQLATKLGFEKIKENKMLWWHEDKSVVTNYLNSFGYENQ